VKKLEIKNTEFHTYKPKQERNLKVVLKNIHSSTNIKVLKKSIETHGHSVINIWNINAYCKQRETGKPLYVLYRD